MLEDMVDKMQWMAKWGFSIVQTIENMYIWRRTLSYMRFCPRLYWYHDRRDEVAADRAHLKSKIKRSTWGIGIPSWPVCGSVLRQTRPQIFPRNINMACRPDPVVCVADTRGAPEDAGTPGRGRGGPRGP